MADAFRKLKYANGSASLSFKPATNIVTTAKYTALNFLPLNLIQQFRRSTNIYFLLISVLTFLPFSPKRPVTMAGTLALVVAVSILKEFVEDYSRAKTDREVNARPTVRVVDGREEEIMWKECRVGDIIKFSKDEEIPCDALLLSTDIDDGKGNAAGYGFVSTANLDGETNLKSLFAMQATKSLQDPAALRDLRITVDYEQPTKDIKNFKGTADIMGNPTTSIKIDNIILRGCKVRNTGYMYGLCLYTGPNTRIVMNSGIPAAKMSDLERVMNKGVLILIGVEFTIALILSIMSTLSAQNLSKATYLQISASNTGAAGFLQMWLTFVISYSHMVPISLIVGMELCKIIQKFWISWDKEMYWPPVSLDEGDKRAEARTSNLLEEVGQVQFIFSDKTGTLTQNVMEFHHASVGGRVYGDNNPATGKCSQFAKPEFGFREPTMAKEYAEGKQDTVDFVLLMALCNTVIPVTKDDGTLEYEAASPDEVALVEAANNMGLSLLERDQHCCKIKDLFKNETKTYFTEKVFEFDSDRKRMSSIVRDEAGNITVWTKGADLVMLDEEHKTDTSGRPYQGVCKQTSPTRDAIVEQMNQFARVGLRTLIVSKRDIPKAEFEAWNTQYQALENKLCNDEEEEQKIKDMKAMMAKLEADQDIIGCTAIEDKLQDDVGRTIEQLIRANINIWVLTGDKKDTAINIAQSCKLLGLPDEMDILGYGDELDSNDPNEVKKVLASMVETHCNSAVMKRACGMVVQGHVMEVILDLADKDPELRENMLKLCDRCQSVVACRMTPSQKRQVVKFVKDYHKEKPITLAIGDGGNDVRMIQEAHVGVGLYGKEGSDAVMASDYALGQFRFLERLLLVHGRYGYIRIALGINYYFYKNMCCVFCEIPFQFFNGFSGMYLFPDWLPQAFNALFTSINTLFMNAVEQDVDPERSLKFPELFIFGQRKTYFNYPRLLLWIFWALTHGIINFFIPYNIFIDADRPDGLLKDFFYFGLTCFITVVFTVNMKLFSETFYWTVWHYVCAFVSFVAVLGLCSLLNVVPGFEQPEIQGYLVQGNGNFKSSQYDKDSLRYEREGSLFSSLKFWYCLFLVPLTCITLDLFLKAIYRSALSPFGINLLHAVQESRLEPIRSPGDKSKVAASD